MSTTFKPGDKVIDPLSFDGVGTVVEVRRSAGLYASGRLRPGTQTVNVVVEFARPLRKGLRVQHGLNGMLTESYTRTISINDLVVSA